MKFAAEDIVKYLFLKLKHENLNKYKYIYYIELKTL